MHLYFCRDLLIIILLSLSNLTVFSQSCSSGYEFTLIPAITLLCDPFFVNDYMDVICQITAATDISVVNIDWYFHSSIEGSSPIRLVNGSHKHSIINSYDQSNIILTSTLRLYNLSSITDTGQYSCQGIIGSDKKLLPEPSLIIQKPSLPIFPPCRFYRLVESGTERCADVVPLPNTVDALTNSSSLPSLHASLTHSFIIASSSIVISDIWTSSKTSNLLPYVTMSSSMTHSYIIIPSSTITSPKSDVLTTSNLSPYISHSYIISPSSTGILISSTKSLQKPNVISSDKMTISTNTQLSSVITSTLTVQSSLSSSSVSVISTINDKGSQGLALHWLYIIATLLTLSLFILIILLLMFTAFFYCHRSLPSLSAIEDVVFRQRTRRPSDPLPPIRDSMILTSDISETTTKSSDISAMGPNTIIHCSPLQNQHVSFGQSLQDMSFSLQCGNGGASSFTVYAEVEDINDTIITRHNSPPPPLPDRNIIGTYSSHCYTLPPDDMMSHDDDTTGTGTGQWSPILIYQGQKENEECDRLSLLSKSDVTLSDIDDTFSHSYHHDNLFVYQQQQQLPNQLNSLREQSFSLNNVPINSHMNYSTNTSSSNSSNDSSLIIHHSQQQTTNCHTTSLQLLFNDHDSYTGEDMIEPVRSSSSSSSGCTDLSKYSGDYERDPNYMRALGIIPSTPVVPTTHHLSSEHTSRGHHQSTSALYQNEEDERELDSGMDGMYYVRGDTISTDYTANHTEHRSLCKCDDYKSLESLTRNPSPVYMKPLWRKQKNSDSVFTTIAV